jgi:hypothetical protein
MTALLAGPIVRRATDNRVCVWVATRSRASLKLTGNAELGYPLP